MKTQLQRIVRISYSVTLLALAGLLVSTAQAVPITITPGNPGNAGTDNVLFNDPSLSHSGTLVQGNFSGSGSGFVVNFTSASGSGNLIGNGGQARIEGGTGNNPFTNLMFELSGGATFTQAILNPDATIDGTINFTVFYISALGSPFMQSFAIDGNGSNFFGIMAGDGAMITKIVFDTTNSAFVDTAQVRIGGFARAAGVPEGGSTAVLLGAALMGVWFVRSRASKASLKPSSVR